MLDLFLPYIATNQRNQLAFIFKKLHPYQSKLSRATMPKIDTRAKIGFKLYSLKIMAPNNVKIARMITPMSHRIETTLFSSFSIFFLSLLLRQRLM